MPCTKCRADFNLLNWKLRCIDCEQFYCSKCLKKIQGVLTGLCCDKCFILNKRPPEREKLMELRAKDLRDYLNRNHISTHGLVEKAELVELFYRRAIPPHNFRKGNRFSSVFSGSVPNLASDPQNHINIVRSNVETNINNVRSFAENAIHSLGRRVGPTASQSTGANFENYSFVYSEPTVPGTERSNSSHEFPRSAPSTPPAPQTQPEPVPPTPQSQTPIHKLPKLSDFKTVEDLNELSVKQLKELLTLNRVNYKGCVEKSELLDRATRLWLDNNTNKKEVFDEAPVDDLCKICMDAPLDCVILECGHVATCVDCGKQLAECPICRQFVTRVVRTFKA